VSDAAQERTPRRTLRNGALLGATGVAAGAFGAHALRDALEPRLLDVFETGARYQLFHAVALLVIGALMAQRPSHAMTWAARLMTAGTLVFAGSLYALALTGIRALGAITPIGGVLLIAGWMGAAVGAGRSAR